MHPAIRTQTDGLNDQASEAAGLSFDPETDMARQEFMEETDINYVLRKYGRLPDARPFTFGDTIDADTDLLTAFEALSNAQASFDQLPQQVRNLYPDVQSLMEAVEKGEVSLGSKPASEGSGAPPEPQAAAPAGAPANPVATAQ